MASDAKLSPADTAPLFSAGYVYVEEFMKREDEYFDVELEMYYAIRADIAP